MHKIPDSLVIGGFKFELKPTSGISYADMPTSTIHYEQGTNQDYMVAEILGQVFRIMLDMNGLLPQGRKKISVDSAQLLKCMQNYMFTFLRDNTVDWRMVALNIQLLEEKQEFAMPPVEELIEDGGVVEGPSLDETASEAMEAIGSFEYEPAPENAQDTMV